MKKLFLPFAALALMAAGYPKPSNPPEPVIDAANVISDDVEADLDRQLTDFSNKYPTVLVVGTTPDLHGAEAFDYSLGWARELGVGHDGSDGGVFLMFAPNEHKVYIQTGYGADDMLTDAEAGQIIDNVIVPIMKNGGTPEEAIVAGVNAIIPQLTPESAEAKALRLKDEAASHARYEAGIDKLKSSLFWLFIGLIGFAPIGFLIHARNEKKREAEEAARQEKLRRLEIEREREIARAKKARIDMLNSMSPADREKFLSDELAALKKAEDDRKKAAIAAAQLAKIRRARERRAARRSSYSPSYGGGYSSGSSFGSSSSSSSSWGSSSSGSFGGFGGGGFGGGGSGGSW
jgi:uncharacterized membrane protein YgcG